MIGHWEERLGLGNTAASLLVRKYLKCIEEEQATAGLTPKQATPLFVDKLAILSDLLDRQLEACQTDPIEMYILPRDQAYFKTLFFSGDRPEDLGQLRTNKIPMMMGYSLATHGEKRFVETDRIFLE